MIKEIKRSKLVRMAESIEIDPNDYIQQVVRECPEIYIINDMKIRSSEKELKILAKRRRNLDRARRRS